MTDGGDPSPHSDEEEALRTVVARLTMHDHRLLAALPRREAPPWLDRPLRLATLLGGATCTVAIAVTLIVLPDTGHLGLVAGMANLCSHLVVQILKRTVVRPRPSTVRPWLTPWPRCRTTTPSRPVIRPPRCHWRCRYS